MIPIACIGITGIGILNIQQIQSIQLIAISTFLQKKITQQNKSIRQMKQNVNKYPNVDRLPKSALTVGDYAKNQGITPSHVYKRYRLNQGGFKIVVFKTLNFVIPR